MKNREGKDSGDGYVWKVERMGKEWTGFPRGRGSLLVTNFSYDNPTRH